MKLLLAIIGFVVPRLAAAQTRTVSDPRSVVGTYRHFTTARAGCAIEVGQSKGDSLRVQFDCNRGAPSYHSGSLDVRVTLHHDTATYQTSEFNGESCSIRFDFGAGRLQLTQIGSDIACGFGAFLRVDGSYPRISRRPPKFDLLPL